MKTQITRDQMIAAFNEIGAAAAEQHLTLEIGVYGGSALVLASNFRVASEDVDINEISNPWPDWLNKAVEKIAAKNGWDSTWLNDAIQFHLSPAATAADHVAYGSYPQGGDREGQRIGLKVFIPTPEYMLALKLKACRFGGTGQKSDLDDIVNLLKALEVGSPQQAIQIMGKFFPKSAAEPQKQEFLLKQIWEKRLHNAPKYPDRSL